MNLIVPDNNKRPYPLLPNPHDVQHQRRQLRHRHQPRAARHRRQQQRLAALDRCHGAERPAGAQLHVHARRPDLQVHRGRLAQPAHDHRHQDSTRSRSPRRRSSWTPAWSSPSARRRPPPATTRAPPCPSAPSPPAPTTPQSLRRHRRSPAAPTSSRTRTSSTRWSQSAGVYVAVQKSYTVYAAHPDSHPAAARGVRPRAAPPTS